ncbi:MAG TPA: prolyl oligopeptidase family serine peptidase [Gammaproteobacteria bacterium]|nr:prolyl oligopeptidase family serine peptidase [Gammaproteobacteria bacterium]
MRLYTLIAAALLIPFAAVARPPSTDTLTLEQITSNPDWISVPALNPYWSADGHKVYFEKQPHGSSIETLYSVNGNGGHVRKVPLGDWSATGSNEAIYNHGLTRQAWIAHGDLFVRNLGNGQVTQITRGASVNSPMFMADGERIAWQQDGRWFVSDPANGLTAAVANLELADAPDAPPTDYDYVTADPLRLFDTLKKKKADAEAERQQQQALAHADASRAGIPWYLGDDIELVGRSLSPNGRWLLLVTKPKGYNEGPQSNMPDYINDDGRVLMHDVHRRVGMNPPAPNHVLLLDLKTHQQHALDETTLPGIKDDPLTKLRQQAIEWDVKHGVTRENAEASVKAPEVRPVRVYGIEWNDAGTEAAIEFVAIDNKDRWIATVDFDNHKLVTVDRLTDPAWINWTHNAFGWLPDNRTIWFLSEKSGWSQLYLTDSNGGDTRALTHGEFVIETPAVSHDGRYIYFQANPKQPGTWNIYRVATRGGNVEQITALPGLNGTQPGLHGDSRFALSPDGSKLLFYHSTTVRPPELYAVDANPGALPVRLTRTITDQFKSIDWVAPKIVKIPSSHVDRPLYARLYLPADYDPNKTYAGAVFVHGAGYLQDAHSGWSYYFHEMMFNNLLAREGYVVFDMDYRGSAGYGRDWRTAIYRNMGHPEVEDIADGVHWIIENYHVVPSKLGVYGGSYGGFMTYMMMFRKPEMFAAGAALRPVADWANYNRGYTSAILNTPNVDPMAYRRSSPIYYAENLQNPLLIEHGLLDDNVFFQDTVYLVQRLIELKKPFDVEFFPMEHHGFVAPTAWLHEYRKIHTLFSTYVNPTNGH